MFIAPLIREPGRVVSPDARSCRRNLILMISLFLILALVDHIREVSYTVRKQEGGLDVATGYEMVMLIMPEST
jgi:hypothetical protein